MNVNEFGDDCPEPNKGYVYIALLDSVQYMQPRGHTTLVYHAVLVNYLANAKDRGFRAAQLWSCALEAGDDYIFPNHALGQKFPQDGKLAEWYTAMLGKAASQGIVLGYTSLCKAYDNLANHEVPYFPGDAVPIVLGKVASRNRMQVIPSITVATAATTTPSNAPNFAGRGDASNRDDEGKPETKRRKLNSTSEAAKTGVAAGGTSVQTDGHGNGASTTDVYQLWSPPGKALRDYDENCFVITLTKKEEKKKQAGEAVEEAASGGEQGDDHGSVPRPAESGIETDRLIEGEDGVLSEIETDEEIEEERDVEEKKLFYTAGSFLEVCDENGYTFETLVDAQYSTMMIVYHLLNPGEDFIVKTCGVAKGGQRGTASGSDGEGGKIPESTQVMVGSSRCPGVKINTDDTWIS